MCVFNSSFLFFILFFNYFVYYKGKEQDSHSGKANIIEAAIKTYYDKDMQVLALLILDNICNLKGFIKEEDILNIVKTYKEVDDEKMKEVINLLWSDHYLERKINERTYRFKYSIIKDWWMINRG